MSTSLPLGQRVTHILKMCVNPGATLQQHLADYSWPWAFGISGLAFTLFFMQTGLDLFRQGAGFIRVAELTIIGALYGTVGVASLAGIAWMGSKPADGTHTYEWTLRAFGLSYSPTLIYVVCGLAANVLLGWNTSVAFGITGALWAMNPMNAAIKEMTAGKTGTSIVLTSLCGGLLLLGWGWISTR